MFKMGINIIISRRLIAVVLLSGAVCPLGGCKADIAVSNEKKDTANMANSEPILLIDKQLIPLLSDSKFKPKSPETMSSKFYFKNNGEVIYITSGEGIIYDLRYFSVHSDKVCIYNDKASKEYYECIKIYLVDNNLFNFHFIKNRKLINKVFYIKYFSN